VGTGVTITNTYTTVPANVEIRADKKLTGGKLLEEGAYSFRLVNNANEQEAYVSRNTVTGAIFFEFDLAAPGVYQYTMSEVEGNDPNTTYDNSEYLVTVTVIDDRAGHLHATVEYGTANGLHPVFTNIYTPSPITVELEATKILLGRDLVKDEFQFVVVDETGAVVANGKNDDSGKVTFGAITYTEAGTHTYTVSEKNLGEKGMVYDDTVFEVTVTVINDNGVLKATVESEILLFTNTYKPPVTPNTGDEAPVGMFVVVSGLAAAAFLGMLLRKKLLR
jgi:pilin isopeptide linkage protein